MVSKRSVGCAADLRNRCTRKPTVGSVQQGEALVVAVRQLVEDLFQKLGEVGPIFLLQLGAEGLLERQSRRTA